MTRSFEQEISNETPYRSVVLSPASILEADQDYVRSEVRGRSERKIIIPHEDLIVNLKYNGFTFSKKNGLLVIDNEAPLPEESKDGEREKFPIKTETHYREIDLWIFAGREMEFIVGGQLVNEIPLVNEGGQIVEHEFRGDSIRGGKKVILSQENRAILIPRGVAHGHGGDGITYAYAYKLSFPEAIRASRAGARVVGLPR